MSDRAQPQKRSLAQPPRIVQTRSSETTWRLGETHKPLCRGFPAGWKLLQSDGIIAEPVSVYGPSTEDCWVQCKRAESPAVSKPIGLWPRHRGRFTLKNHSY